MSESRSSSATMIQLATSDEPPAARNGVVRPVSGMTRVTPPMTMKHLQRDDEGEADAEQLAEVVLAGEADAEAAGHEQQVEREDREDAGEPELFAEARDDVVALGTGVMSGRPWPEPGADEPAVGETEQALHELVAAADLRRRSSGLKASSQFAKRSPT